MIVLAELPEKKTSTLAARTHSKHETSPGCQNHPMSQSQLSLSAVRRWHRCTVVVVVPVFWSHVTTMLHSTFMQTEFSGYRTGTDWGGPMNVVIMKLENKRYLS